MDLKQAKRVQETALLLFEKVTHWHNYKYRNEIKDILLWASQLHEVGLVINHKGLQKHSAYILQNMELPGFNKEQQRLSSYSYFN